MFRIIIYEVYIHFFFFFSLNHTHIIININFSFIFIITDIIIYLKLNHPLHHWTPKHQIQHTQTILCSSIQQKFSFSLLPHQKSSARYPHLPHPKIAHSKPCPLEWVSSPLYIQSTPLSNNLNNHISSTSKGNSWNSLRPICRHPCKCKIFTQMN